MIYVADLVAVGAPPELFAGARIAVWQVSARAKLHGRSSCNRVGARSSWSQVTVSAAKLSPERMCQCLKYHNVPEPLAALTVFARDALEVEAAARQLLSAPNGPAALTHIGVLRTAGLDAAAGKVLAAGLGTCQTAALKTWLARVKRLAAKALAAADDGRDGDGTLFDVACDVRPSLEHLAYAPASGTPAAALGQGYATDRMLAAADAAFEAALRDGAGYRQAAVAAGAVVASFEPSRISQLPTSGWPACENIAQAALAAWRAAATAAVQDAATVAAQAMVWLLAHRQPVVLLWSASSAWPLSARTHGLLAGYRRHELGRVSVLVVPHVVAVAALSHDFWLTLAPLPNPTPAEGPAPEGAFSATQKVYVQALAALFEQMGADAPAAAAGIAGVAVSALTDLRHIPSPDLLPELPK